MWIFCYNVLPRVVAPNNIERLTMCLRYNQIEPTHQGKRTVWKILTFHQSRRCKRSLRSIYRCNYAWSPGINHSDRSKTTLTEDEILYHQIDRGFHVFTSRVVASSYLGLINTGRYLVEMTVDSDDFVAENTAHHEAVYTKATISEKEYTKVTGN